MLRIRRDDTVMVMAGKDKGKTGKVVRVFPKKAKAVVENVNVVKKSVKKSDTYPQGGYVEVEKPLAMANLMLVDKKTDKPTRFKVKVLKDGSKERIALSSQESI
ncbi:MAG: 50S ribosomal protein L24 [Candidatus Omnitrophica bacterium]|nr:50S ribosomal protein L24 [Candidatus Omnitrophota bacterium]MDE2008512.1 50S ribosomal protein L24 [Candidatus Omnitrophota bacterium]MDE2213978.1 50S ribosomal protein L24 [Candidatus Omnitrophota bacterium]MDE2231367.1 50S ribosomal protein L24 [Candidatus Omnitrophota bacterium]